VNFLEKTLGPASKGGVKFYALDNEPDLWSETHPRIHPQKTGYWELMNKSESAAYGILKADPSALVFGPASYGWSGFLNLQNAPDSAEANKSTDTFLDFYLDQMKYIEKRDGKRLLHVLDVHWYPEAQGGGKRITENDVTPASIEARLQAPRSLWDPTYVETSWIATSWQKPIRLISWLQEKIDKHYPGTQLAFTEYDYGAGDHVSGGLAQADALGIFGKNAVFMSNYWGDLKPYNKAALKLYRNYDGSRSHVGDTAISAATQNVIQTSIYAFTNSKTPGKLWVLVINKDQKETLTGKFQIGTGGTYKTYASYGFDALSPEIKALKKGGIGDNKFSYDLAPLSATLFVLQ
jgi:mannan endo-1,4-beta-mannosidase